MSNNRFGKHPSTSQTISKSAQTERFFLPKQILLFVCIFIAVLFLDVFLYIVFTFIELQNTSNSYSGEGALTTISENITVDASGAYSLSLPQESVEELYQKIDEHKWGALYLDSTGETVWSYHAPETAPTHFSQNDIALLSYYRTWGDYSTLIWTDDNGGMTILFRPSKEYGGVTLFIPDETFKHLPLYITLMLFVDGLIFFLFYLFSRRSVEKFINPALIALDNLAQNRPTRVSFSGSLRLIGNKINRVSETLIKKETARKNWVEGVSHDVRTPLSVIMGHSETIKFTTQDPSIKNSAEIITQQSIRIRDLVEDLNIATQLEYDMQPLKNSTLIVARLLREFVASNLNQATNSAYPITLSISPEANQITIQGDEKLLIRALQNALNNAMKHNPHGCDITIELTCDNSTFSIALKDSGRGMDATALNELSERLREESFSSYYEQNLSIEAPILKEYEAQRNEHIQQRFNESEQTSNKKISINQTTTGQMSTKQTTIGHVPSLLSQSSSDWKHDHENPVISGQDYTPYHAFQSTTKPKNEPSKDGSTIRQHGIGLSLINRIVVTHGGILKLENAPQHGFCLTMIFPREK